MDISGMVLCGISNVFQYLTVSGNHVLMKTGADNSWKEISVRRVAFVMNRWVTLSNSLTSQAMMLKNRPATEEQIEQGKRLGVDLRGDSIRSAAEKLRRRGLSADVEGRIGNYFELIRERGLAEGDRVILDGRTQDSVGHELYLIHKIRSDGKILLARILPSGLKGAIRPGPVGPQRVEKVKA